MMKSRLCECGCGEPTTIARSNSSRFAHVKGLPMRFRRGHYLKLHPITKQYPRPSITERFWKNVDKSGDCWIWTGATTGNGYGTIRYRGKQEGAHRVAWILTNGDITAGLLVRHSCDNSLCVRVDHLSLGTTADNSRDAVSRGRQARGGRSGHSTHPECTARGERNGSAVLTVADVTRIRQLHSSSGLSLKEIARRLSVSDVTIGHIVRRKTWQHVEDFAQ